MKKVNGIIFDMDGLLFDTERIYYEAAQKVADEMGFAYDEALYNRFIGVSDEELWANYHEIFAHQGKMQVQRFIDESYALALEAFNTTGAKIKPGVIELLAFLNDQKIPRVVASSNQRSVIETLLEKAALRSEFDQIISADDVTRAKPDPEIFQIATRYLGTKPEETLVLEDSKNGILAAHQAQIPVIMIPDRILPTADLKAKSQAILPSLDQVINYLNHE